MKQKQISSLFLLLFSTLFGYAQTKVVSYNIRYNNPNDAENCWENRREEVVKVIDFYHPQFLGVQEGLKDQVDFINEKLVDYNYIGVGRDDGKTKGEFAAIFYDTTKFQLVENKTFWLSETPGKISVGWDASMERIVTYGAFKDRESGNPIFIFNAHFDHIGELSRKKSAKLILQKVEEFGLKNCRVIVMGDLNCEPKDKPIRVFGYELDDAMEISENPFFGPVGTYNGFHTDSIATKRIDYIFTKNVKVLNYSHIGDKRENNLHLSDHFPVFMEISDCIANYAIYNRWKLVNVKTETEYLFPKVDLFLTVEKNLEEDISHRQGEYLLKFNLDLNKCWCYADITPDKIIYKNVACTEMCCDGKIDTIGNFLNYNGSYKISNDTLTIVNDNIYTLIKVVE